MVFELLDPRIQTGPPGQGHPRADRPAEGGHPAHPERGATCCWWRTPASARPKRPCCRYFHRLLGTPGKGIKCIYITPLRALNRDMLKRLTEFGEALDLDVAVRHGDTSQTERQHQSKNPPDVLITTPETLQVLFTGKRLREHLSKVRCVVIDEIHELANNERGAQLSVALERLIEVSGEFQRIGLSATVGSVDEVANYLGGAEREVRTVRAQISKDLQVTVQSPEVTDADRDLAGRLQSDPHLVSGMRRCKQLIEEHRSTLLFVNTRDTAEALAARYHIWDEDFKVGVHHGSLSKEIRIEMEEEFKQERLKGLICTSSLELGIDIGSVDFAIQYNSPRQVSRLIQRMGRAGHSVGERSEGAIVASNPDEIAESLVIARKAMKEELEELRVREWPMAVLANQLVAMAMTGQVEKELGLPGHQALLPLPEPLPGRVPRGAGAAGADRAAVRQRAEVPAHQPGDALLLRQPVDDPGRADLPHPGDRARADRRLAGRIVRGLLRRAVRHLHHPWDRPGGSSRSRRTSCWWSRSGRSARYPPGSARTSPCPSTWPRRSAACGGWRTIADYAGTRRPSGAQDQYLEEQRKDGAVPSDKLVTLEMGKRLAILNMCFGTKVNETVSKILSVLLSARLGESVGVHTDPYRIVIELPRDIKPQLIIDTLKSIRSEGVESLVRLVLKSPHTFDTASSTWPRSSGRSRRTPTTGR